MGRPPTHPRRMLVVALVLALTACGGDASVPDTTGSPATTASTTPADGPLALTLEVVDASLSGGVVVAVRLTNRSPGPVTVLRPAVSPNFVRFHVTDDLGTTLPFAGEYPRLEPLGDDGFVGLAPGESVEHAFTLATLFALPTGEVTVGAEYRNPGGASHHGERALTFDAGAGVVADPVVIGITP